MSPFRVLFYLGLFLSPAFAAGSVVTYHGRLLNSDGTAVTANLVKFKIQIRTPGSEDCLLFQETYQRDLSVSNGAFAISINDGTASVVNTEPFAFDRIFQNRGSFAFAGGRCATGSTYSPAANDGRKIVVQFDDGSGGGWEDLPAQTVGAIPLAIESVTVGGFKGGELFRVVDGSGQPVALSAWTQANYNALLGFVAGTTPLPGNAAGFTGSLSGDVSGLQGTTSVDRIKGRTIAGTAPSDGQVLKWSSANSRWEPAADAGGASSVTSLTVTAPVTNTGTANVPNIGISAATTSAVGVVTLATDGQNAANVVVQGNDSRLSNSRAPNGSAGGDLSGSFPSPDVVKLRGVSVSATAPTSAQVLVYDGSAWSPTTFGIGNLKTNTGTSQFASAACTASQTLTWSAVNDTFTCTNISLNASAVSSGILPVANGGTGTSNGSITGTGTLTFTAGGSNQNIALIPSGSGSTLITGNVGIGTTTANSALTVKGAAINSSSILNATSTIDFATGNLQYTSANCGTFNLHNLKDGGSYVFGVKGTTSTTCAFNAFSDAGSTALTVHLPVDHGATTAGKHTLYNLMVLGTDVYVGWIPGM